MKEIDLIAETDYTVEKECIEIDYIVEIDHETTIRMTIEGTIDMTMERKIIGISKTRNIRESIEIIMKTHMKTGKTRIITEIVTKTKIEIKTKNNTEMTAMTKLEVSLREKNTHMMRMTYLTHKSKECTNIRIIIKTDTTRTTKELATKTGINIDTNTEMTAMTKTEVGLEKEVTCLRQGKLTISQRLKESTKSYDS